MQNGVYLHHESGADSSGAPQPAAGSGYSDDGGERRASADSLCRVTYVIRRTALLYY